MQGMTGSDLHRLSGYNPLINNLALGTRLNNKDTDYEPSG